MRSQSTSLGSVVVMDSMFASESNQRRTDVMKGAVVPVFFGELILKHAFKDQNISMYHGVMSGMLMDYFLIVFEKDRLMFDGHTSQGMHQYKP